MELTTIGRSIRSPFRRSPGADTIVEEDEELRLRWAAIEKLPTFKRIKTSVLDIEHGTVETESDGKESDGKKVTDVTKLGAVDKHLFIEKLIKHIEHDNLRLLQKLRERIDRYLKFCTSLKNLWTELLISIESYVSIEFSIVRVNVKLPTVEVRYKNVCVDAQCEVVQGKPLPTLWNSVMSMLSVSWHCSHLKPLSCSNPEL